MHKLRFEAKEKISPEVGAVLISYTITPMPGALAMYVAVVVLLTVEGGDVPCREWFSGFLHTVCKTAKFFHLFLDEAIDSRAFSTSALRCDSARAIPFAGENSAREKR